LLTSHGVTALWVRSPPTPPGKVCLVGWGTLFRKQVRGSAVGVRHLCLPPWRSGATEARRAFTPEVVGSSPTCVTTPPSDNGESAGFSTRKSGVGTPWRYHGQARMTRPIQCGEGRRRTGWLSPTGQAPNALLRSHGTVAEHSGTRLQLGGRW
jgi:hypothetical protein